MQRLDATGGEKIQQYLRENIFFDLTHPHSWGQDPGRGGARDQRRDHYLFGSSFPRLLRLDEPGRRLRAEHARDQRRDRDLVLAGNAKRLFNLPIEV